MYEHSTFHDLIIENMLCLYLIAAELWTLWSTSESCEVKFAKGQRGAIYPRFAVGLRLDVGLVLSNHDG